MRITTVALFLSGVFAVASVSDAQPPGGGFQPPGGKGGKGGFGEKGGKGGFGGMPGAMPQPGQIMATFIQEMLKLTDAQKKELDTLQKDVDARLDKLLTAEQKQQLKEMKDRGPGRGGPGGGFGGPGGFGGQKGGPGGGGGEPPAKKP